MPSAAVAAAAVAAAATVFISARYFGRVLHSRQQRVQELIGESTGVAEESLGNMRTVRQFAAEPNESRRYGLKIDHVCDEGIRVGKSQAIFDGGMHVAGLGAIAGVIGYGGMQVLEGAMSASDLTSFLMCSLFVAGNTSALSLVCMAT